MEARVDPSYLGPASTFIGIPMLFIIGFMFIYGIIKRWPFFMWEKDSWFGGISKYSSIKKYIGDRGIIAINFFVATLAFLLGILGILDILGFKISIKLL